jgi:hypothetical protein
MYLCVSMVTFLTYLVLLTAACVPDKWKGNETLDFHDNESYVNTPTRLLRCTCTAQIVCRFISIKYKDIE